MSNGTANYNPVTIKLEETDYVVVNDPNGGEMVELPTDPNDNTLALVTLEHAFPGAHGLKYKNPKTGASRALMLDPTGTRFMPPAGGWCEKVFSVILRAGSSAASTSVRKHRRRFKRSTKRKVFILDQQSRPGTSLATRDTSLSTSNSSVSRASELVCKRLEQFIFHSKCAAIENGTVREDDTLRIPVSVFSSHMFPGRFFAVTCNHGTHEHIPLGAKMKIYNRKEEAFVVEVILKHKLHDFILLESFEKKLTDERAPEAGLFIAGLPYHMVGYPDAIEQKLGKGEQPHYMILRGIIMSESRDRCGHICGSSGAMHGFSGGPVFSDHLDFVGICLKGPDVDANREQTTALGHLIQEQATYCRILPAVLLEYLLREKEPVVPSPDTKKDEDMPSPDTKKEQDVTSPESKKRRVVSSSQSATHD